MLHQPRQMQYQTKPIRCHQLSSQARARAFYRHQDIFILGCLQFEFQVQCDLISFQDRHNLDMNGSEIKRYQLTSIPQYCSAGSYYYYHRMIHIV